MGSFSVKMVNKSVGGWTSRLSFPVQNFMDNSPFPWGGGGGGFFLFFFSGFFFLFCLLWSK